MRSVIATTRSPLATTLFEISGAARCRDVKKVAMPVSAARASAKKEARRSKLNQFRLFAPMRIRKSKS